MSEISSKKDRIIYYDYIRVFAIFAVIMLHVSANHLPDADVHSVHWNAFNIYNSVSRWGVPAFVMLSGALFLPREIPIKKIYTKYISRMAVSYFAWSLFYSFLSCAVKYLTNQPIELTWRKAVSDLFHASYHMWFIPMIIGLYMCIPFFQQLIKSKKATEYFLIISFIFVSLLPFLYSITRDFIGGPLYDFISPINDFVQNLQMGFSASYVIYFILGYFLSVTDFSKKQRLILYIAGAAGLVATVLLTSAITLKTGKLNETYHNAHFINVFLSAIAVFVWCKYNLNKNIRINRLIQKLSKCSYGAYLVHVAVISVITAKGFSTLAFNGFLSAPVMFIIVASAAFLISFIISKIPFLNKWIV